MKTIPSVCSVRQRIEICLTSTRIKPFVSLQLNVCQAVSDSKCARLIFLENLISETLKFSIMLLHYAA